MQQCNVHCWLGIVVQVVLAYIVHAQSVHIRSEEV